MSKRVSKHVTWVGKTDWELDHFHGQALSTGKGSSGSADRIRGSLNERPTIKSQAKSERK